MENQQICAIFAGGPEAGEPCMPVPDGAYILCADSGLHLAERLGCSYVTLGHIYATACKLGLPPRGRDLLRRACAAARIPVYAIGGITPARLAEVCADGAAGACVMSGLMRGSDWIPGIEKIC